jgi:murein DD-endopeptidase MepM/ murein hydrolase activator NlpD
MATFPLPFRPSLSYKTGGRFFGNDRGGVLHAACDLIAPKGTPVLAVEAGKVLRGPLWFFLSGPKVEQDGKQVCAPGVECLLVYERQVKHATFIARYGEIDRKLPPGIAPGVEVKEGQVIAYVGAQTVSTMLHFEMFANVNDREPLTKRGNMKYDNFPKPKKTYSQRKDLMDPTAYLDGCKLKG